MLLGVTKTILDNVKVKKASESGTFVAATTSTITTILMPTTTTTKSVQGRSKKIRKKVKSAHGRTLREMIQFVLFIFCCIVFSLFLLILCSTQILTKVSFFWVFMCHFFPPSDHLPPLLLYLVFLLYLGLTG